MRVAVLDDPVEAPEEVPVGAGRLGEVQCIENRLVVLVHQHHDAVARVPVQGPQQIAESLGRRIVPGLHARLALDGVELRHDVRVQPARFPKLAAAEAQAQHGMTRRPVPGVVDGQPLEQRPVALERLLHRVQEQALTKAPGARQEVVLALVDQPRDVRRLVDVVAVALAKLAEGLDADRELPSGHRRTLPAAYRHRESGSSGSLVPDRACFGTPPTPLSRPR